MSRLEPIDPLGRKVLGHFALGRPIEELPGKLGMSFQELALRVDFKALRRKVGGLRWLLER